MLLTEELFFIPFWGMPVMAGRSSGMAGVSFLLRLASYANQIKSALFKHSKVLCATRLIEDTCQCSGNT